MKRALIISPYYAPSNLVAAIRATKITKFLVRDEGYSVDVISFPGNYPKDPTLVPDLAYINQHLMLVSKFFFFVQKIFPNQQCASSVQVSSKPEKNASEATVKQHPFRKWLLEVALFTYEQTLAHLLYKSSKKFVRKNSQKYDLIFSTYGPYASHMIGSFAKKCNPGCFWIADFRDPVMTGSESSKLIVKKKNIYVQKRCSQADAITAVSSGVLEKLDSLPQHKSYVVTNGFDPDDVGSIQKNTDNKRRLIFAYCGTLYGGKRNLETLFKALQELIQADRIKKDLLRIHYAGSEGNQMLHWASKYGLEESLHDYGMVSRERSLEIQNESSILLLASWNKVGYTGVITGKFYEYLMMKKNILCFVSGNLASSDLKSMIETADVGFCFEEASKDHDYQRLLEFLENTFNEYTQSGKLRYSPNKDFVDRFRYSEITKKLLKIAEGI